MLVNLARTIERSGANGPGDRFVLWAQGCPLACAGCWNPDTWSFRQRDVRTIDELVATILATAGIEGVTFTGGEPFAQAAAFAELGVRLRAAGLSVFVFTGYDLGELAEPEHRSLLKVTDVLVAGPYVQTQRVSGLPWRGSSNQVVHFLTDRYGPRDMQEAGEIEFHLGHLGSIAVTGFPVGWEFPMSS